MAVSSSSGCATPLTSARTWSFLAITNRLQHQIADAGLSRSILNRATQLRKAARACPELSSGGGFSFGGNYALIATVVDGKPHNGSDNGQRADVVEGSLCDDAVATLLFYGL